ncbi:hypothetical protein QPK87_25355 [Kamptonema cortianum]|nr:hypothetical protein [Kamptonema cortianum]
MNLTPSPANRRRDHWVFNESVTQIKERGSKMDRRALLEMELELLELGYGVSYTSQLTQICLSSAALIHSVPGRNVVSAYQMRGKSYLPFWDIEGLGRPSDRFYQMQSLLVGDRFDGTEGDRIVRDFEYELRRQDGAIVRYNSTFLWLSDPEGEPMGIRACISHADDWEIIYHPKI